jgi:hypothetical protein
MTDSVKDDVKDTCKPVLDNKGNDQVVVPIISSDKNIKKSFYEEVGEALESLDISSDKNIKKSFYEEVGEALEYLDKCDGQSDLSSVNSADINEVENMFGHLFLRDDNRSESEEILQID